MTESITIDIYTSTYAPWGDWEMTPERLDLTRDNETVERSPAVIAEWLYNAGATEATAYAPHAADRRTWYYSDPYTAEREEKNIPP